MITIKTLLLFLRVFMHSDYAWNYFTLVSLKKYWLKAESKESFFSGDTFSRKADEQGSCGELKSCKMNNNFSC